MHCLVAFDKFKDSLEAAEACASAQRAVREIHPEWTCDVIPLTDGGEGFARILTQQAGGLWHPLNVRGPRGETRTAGFGIVHGERLRPAVWPLLGLPRPVQTLALVEMATASGLQGLPQDLRDPWQTSTYGTGELLKSAVASGAEAIVLGLGGSATNDLGVGALEALGLKGYDHRLQPVSPLIPARWRDVVSVGGLVNVRQLPPLRLASDVENPLLGPQGATAVFGPQKGLRAEDYARLERAMGAMARRLLGLFGVAEDAVASRLAEPGTGAAGGLGFGLRTAWPGAAFVPGFALVRTWLGLDEARAGADLILTGEGSFDASSLTGKGPGALLRDLRPGQRALVFAGRVVLPPGQALPGGLQADDLCAITPAELPWDQAQREASNRLYVAVREVLRQRYPN